MIKFSATNFKWLASLWLLFISVLFFLPGSALPKENWLDKIYVDKWVHVAFFTVLLFLWRIYFPANRKYSRILLILAFTYGLSVEVIQHFFVENRSFDTGDLIADMLGGVLGIRLWNKRYIKK